MLLDFTVITPKALLLSARADVDLASFLFGTKRGTLVRFGRVLSGRHCGCRGSELNPVLTRKHSRPASRVEWAADRP
jgi:hypothetical protein